MDRNPHPRVLVVGAHPWLLLAVVRALGAAGMKVEVASPLGFPPVRSSRHCRRYWRLSEGGSEAGHELIRARVRAGIDVVLPSDVNAARLLASSGDNRLLPSREVIETADDKAAFAKFLGAHHLPHPQTELITDRSVLTTRPFAPCVLKPARAGNAEGFRYVRSSDELNAYLANEDLGGPLLRQEYLPGDEVDCSVLVDHGEVVAWTCQRAPWDPREREMLEDAEALGLTRNVVRALGYHGVCHLDLRRDANRELRVLELNPRFWMSLQYSMWAGVNFPALAVRMALGEPVRQPTFVPGVYRSPTLARLWSEMGRIRKSRRDTRALWQTLSDPFPQAVQTLERFF